APTNEDNVCRGVFRLPLCVDTASHLDDFQRLLIIRAAHPEYFPDAVCQWVKQHSRDLDLQNCCLSIESMAVLDQNIFGILVIEPSTTSKISYSGTILSHKAKQTITSTAKEKNIPLLLVSIKNDNEEELETAVNDTMNQNGWLIIQNLHLASKAMLKNLFKILKYAAKMQASQKEERQYCVWLTSEHGASIPKDFLAHLKKVSWHFLLMMNKDRKKLSLNDWIYIDHLPQLLLSAITSAMDQINEETCSRVKKMPTTIQRLYFGICVLYGVLKTQWIFPKTGLNHLMDMSPVQLHQVH
ncbi:hypothetical protein AB205_0097630, partial [Aquarana catesbeiana]